MPDLQVNIDSAEYAEQTNEKTKHLEAFLDEGLQAGGATPLREAFREMEKKYGISVSV